MEQWSLPNDLAQVRVTGKHAAFVFCIVLRRGWPPCLLSVSCFHLFVFFYSMFSAVLFVFCLLHCSWEDSRRRWPSCLLSLYNAQCIEFCKSTQHQNDSFTMLLGGGGDDHQLWRSGRSVCVWHNDCSSCSSYVKVTNTKSVNFVSICTCLNGIYLCNSSRELFIYIVLWSEMPRPCDQEHSPHTSHHPTEQCYVYLWNGIFV